MSKTKKKLKLFKHKGKGHYIGSSVIVIEFDLESASKRIRKILDTAGLSEEELDIETLEIQAGLVVQVQDGDY